MSGADGSRHINGIQGLLIREYYPGFVTHNGEEKPPMKWEHFYSVISNGETLAAKIKRELWVRMCCCTVFLNTTHLLDAIETIDTCCLCAGLLHVRGGERAACGTSSGGGVQITFEGPVPRGAPPVRHYLLRQRAWPGGEEAASQGDVQQRETDLTEEQYVQVIKKETSVLIQSVKYSIHLVTCYILDVLQMCPEWCDKYQDCWLAIVRIWRSDASYEQHRERRRRRLQMQGAPHHQGNRSLPQYIEKWVCFYSNLSSNTESSLPVTMFVFSSQSQAHGGQDCNEMMGYALSHKGRATAPDNVYDEEDGPDAYTNSSVYPKIDAYRRAFRQRHGETSDPATEPLDTDLLMRLGPGKQHGSYMMANSAIDPSSAPTLREIRRGGSSSSSDIPIAPRQPSSAQMFSQFQVSAVSFVVHSFHT